MRTVSLYTFGLAVLLLAIGGTSRLTRRAPMPADETPWMNLPLTLREWNWGGGSCVHASTVHCLRWQNQGLLAARWRATYAGGESSYGLRAKLDANGVNYTFTERGNEALLDYASRTRRGAVIFYYPNHSINFCGFATRAGQDFAVLLDNNRINNFIWVPRDRFLREWRGYGGFALTPLFPPAARLSYWPF